MARFVALMVLCLVVATAAAQAQATGGFRIGVAPIVTTFTTAKFVVTTPVATRLTIATGTDRTYLIPTPDRLKFRHVVSVRGLAPNTNYYALITATPKTGKAVKVWKTFKTAAPGSAPATVTARGNKILLNGQPFFPIMVGAFTCPDQEFVRNVSLLGTSILDFVGGTGCGGDRTLTPAERVQKMHTLLNGQVWWLERYARQEVDRQELQDLPELIGGQLSVLKNWEQPIIEDVCSATTKLYSAVAQSTITQTVVYWASLAIAPHRSGEVWCLDGQSLKMAYWTVVSAGGDGVAYSTRDAGNTSYFDVRPDVLAQAAKQSRQMATLGPCILTGKPVAVKSDTRSSLRFGAWRYGESTCIIAVNTKNTATIGTFGVDSLAKAKTAQVMWEGRNVKVASGSISDRFAPLAVHIYKVLPAPVATLYD